MSRPIRFLGEGALYHVMSRGNARMAIYHDDADRRRFLTLLAEVVEQYRLECHAFCLMSNHYHALVTTLDPNLSEAMRQLNGGYAQWWNRRHDRVGHVFQGRFKGQLVQRDGHFLEACRYVVLNPVRAALVSRPEDWPWSSYAATAGLRARFTFLTTRMVLSGPATRAARLAYRVFVETGTSGCHVGAAIRSDRRIIGDDAFVESQKAAIDRAHPTEVPGRERRLARTPLTELFADVRDARTRNVRIIEARRKHRYRLAEIAAHLGLHYASVSRIVSTR
jgi:REP element-mobilizing transposase RayT